MSQALWRRRWRVCSNLSVALHWLLFNSRGSSRVVGPCALACTLWHTADQCNLHCTSFCFIVVFYSSAYCFFFVIDRFYAMCWVTEALWQRSSSGLGVRMRLSHTRRASVRRCAHWCAHDFRRRALRELSQRL